jgi:hypothetical protein
MAGDPGHVSGGRAQPRLRVQPGMFRGPDERGFPADLTRVWSRPQGHAPSRRLIVCICKARGDMEASGLLRWMLSWEGPEQRRFVRVDICATSFRYIADTNSMQQRRTPLPSGNHDRNTHPAGQKRVAHIMHAHGDRLPRSTIGVCATGHRPHFRVTGDSNRKLPYIPPKEVTRRDEAMAIPVLRSGQGPRGQERQMSTRAQSSLLPTSRCSAVTRSPAPDRNPWVTSRSASPRSLSMPASMSRPGASTRPSV